MKKKLILMVVLAMIFTVSATASFAYEVAYKKSSGHYGKVEDKLESKAHMILKNKEELGLSEEQAKKVKDIMHGSKKGEIMQNAEIETISIDIKSKMWEDTVDTEAINALIDKKYELKKAKAKSWVAACAQLKNILTEEQRDKLKELYKKCKAGKKKSHH